MASASPPNSSPSSVPPISTGSPPPLSTPSDPLQTSTPPSSQPNQTSDPPTPATSATPSTPSTPSPQSPPPPPSSPPPQPPPITAAPPPVPPSSPPPSPPVSFPAPTSPPVIRSPPPASRVPPPVVASPPPPVLSSPPPQRAGSPPPPSAGGSPPPVSPLPPVASPPPRADSPSPPPPANVPPPTSLPSNSPPPSSANPPKNSPPPARPTPPAPSRSHATPPPSPNSPPPLSSPPTRDPPRPVPSPPSLSPPPSFPSPPSPPASPPINSSTGGIPPIPTSPFSPSPSGIPAPRPTDPAPDVQGNFNSMGGRGLNTGGAVAIGIAVGFVVLSVVGMVVWFMRKQRRKVSGYNGGYVMPSPFGSSQKSDTSFMKTHSSAPLVGSRSGGDFIYSPPEPAGLGNSRSWFTYKELLDITNGFSTENLLGEGGFGSVYKGCLADGREVAVKQLKIGGAQGEREFRAEVEIISRVHHRHLVSLVGYCISEHQRLLVYDYVPNNTLYYHLHGEGRPVMDWATRVKVAAGAARGIAYLHEDCHPRIIHRDIKSSNILLDNNFEAQVSDFGLAKLALDTYTHVSTRVMGTFGYMAPEYASSGKLTEKSDVYSFGVVLLELITGRKPVDASQPLGDESLVEWARTLLGHALESRDFEGLVDPRLENNYIESEMFRMMEAAAACVRHLAARRPRMGQVVRALDCIGDPADLNNGIRPGQSEILDSVQQSEEIRMFRRMAFGSQNYSTGFFNNNSWSLEHGRS